MKGRARAFGQSKARVEWRTTTTTTVNLRAPISSGGCSYPTNHPPNFRGFICYRVSLKESAVGAAPSCLGAVVPSRDSYQTISTDSYQMPSSPSSSSSSRRKNKRESLAVTEAQKKFVFLQVAKKQTQQQSLLIFFFFFVLELDL